MRGLIFNNKNANQHQLSINNMESKAKDVVMQKPQAGVPEGYKVLKEGLANILY